MEASRFPLLRRLHRPRRPRQHRPLRLRHLSLASTCPSAPQRPRRHLTWSTRRHRHHRLLLHPLRPQLRPRTGPAEDLGRRSLLRRQRRAADVLGELLRQQRIGDRGGGCGRSRDPARHQRHPDARRELQPEQRREGQQGGIWRLVPAQARAGRLSGHRVRREDQHGRHDDSGRRLCDDHREPELRWAELREPDHDAARHDPDRGRQRLRVTPRRHPG